MGRVRWAADVTIQDLGSLGEVIGALATVATLLYLAIQIRANTRATQAEARRTNQQTRMSAHSEIIASEDVATIFDNGLKDRDLLSASERTRFDLLFSRMIGDAQILCEEEVEGYSNSRTVEYAITPLVRMLRAPGGAAYWAQWAHSFYPEFRDRIDAEIRVAAADPPSRPAAQQSASANSD